MKNLENFNITRHPKYKEDKWLLTFFKNNPTFGKTAEEMGLKDEDFYNPEYMMDVDEDELDLHATENFEVISVYRYISEAYGPSGVGPNTRPFCRLLMGANRVYTRDDIFQMNTWEGKADRAGGGAYSVFKYRGGNYCKHKWKRYNFDTSTGRLLKPTFFQPNQPSTKP